METINWINKLVEEGSVCKEYADRIKEAKSKKDFFDFACEVDGAKFLTKQSWLRKDLPLESIAKDFSNRYGANTIKQVCSGNNFYRHTGQQETYVYCEDKAGDELLVVYVDNVWNRSILTLSSEQVALSATCAMLRLRRNLASLICSPTISIF